MCAQRAKTAEKDLYLNFEKFQKKILEPDLDPDYRPNTNHSVLGPKSH